MVLPLFKRPIFPGIVAPIIVPNEPFTSTLQAIREHMPINVGLFLAKDTSGRSPFTKLDHIHQVGLLAQVMRVFPHKQVKFRVDGVSMKYETDFAVGDVSSRIGGIASNQS